MTLHRSHDAEIAAARRDAHARAECRRSVEKEVSAAITVAAVMHNRPPVEPLLDVAEWTIRQLARIDRAETQDLLSALFDAIELDHPGDDDRGLSRSRTTADIAHSRITLERAAARQAEALLGASG